MLGEGVVVEWERAQICRGAAVGVIELGREVLWKVCASKLVLEFAQVKWLRST